MVALVECMLCKMQHFLLLRCSNLQLIRILQAETGYIQPPPPQGYLQSDGAVLVSEQYVVEYHVVLGRESCKLAKAEFYTSYFVLELYIQPFCEELVIKCQGVFH